MLLTALFGPCRLQRKDLTKTLLVMRLTSILLLATCLHLSAKTRGQQITLSEEHASLGKVFRKITGQTGYLFVYRDEWLRQAQPVDINVKDASLQQVLDICFFGQPFTYVIIDKMVVLKERTAIIRQPELIYVDPSALIDVHGRVIDANGNPLAGATVMLAANRQDADQFIKARTAAMENGRRGNSSELAPMEIAAPQAAYPVQAGAPGQIVTPAQAGAPARPTHFVTVMVTDANGEFFLKGAPENATLFISNVGFETQELKINKRKDITVRLAIKVNQLSNVEVTYNSGYQVLSKERATGAYSKPDMEIFKARSGTMDVVSRLDGLVPGLTVIAGPNGVIANRNGNGKTTQSALIRGKSSVGLSTEPLYVVNGVVVTDYADVEPDDIADITVLKDAAAAAIWGARAANGVIVVTTKSGKRDSKIKVNYSGYINFQGKPDFGYSPMLSSRQYIQAARETFDPVEYPWGSLYNDYIAPHDLILYNQYRGLITDAQANASLDSLAGINNMGQIKDIWFRNALTTNHTLSLSGGGSVYSFYSSLSYTDTKSNSPGAKNNSYRINFTQDINPNRNIKISLTTALANTVSSSENPIAISNSFLPYQLFKDAQGHSISMPYVQGWSDSLRNDYQARSRINLDYNPIGEMNLKNAHNNNLAVNITANASIRIWKGLSFLGTYGYAQSPGTSNSYDDHNEYSMRRRLVGMTVAPTTASTPVYYLPTTGGQYIHTTNDQRNWTVRNQLAYVANPRNGKDELSVQVGQEAQEQHNTREQLILEGYDQNLETYATLDYNLLSQGIFNTVSSFYGGYYTLPFSVTDQLQRYDSYFALANYTFNHKYSIDGSWRQDHSNLFGHDRATQNRPIWSVGGKWQLSKENFMKPVRWVNELGLRTTYGITGNSPYIGTASTKDILRVSYPYPAVSTGPALDIQGNANTTLTWETTQTLNIGIDYSLLKNRIGGSIDLYHKSTVDLLGNVALNPFTGVTSGTGNIGHLVNKGIELNLHMVNFQTRDFSWSTGLRFSYNKNKLVSYSTPSPYSLTASGKLGANHWIGYSSAPLFAYQFAGLDNLGDPQIRLADKTVTKTPNAAGVDDVVYKGTTIPVFNGGFTNTFRYKGFSLSVNMIYSLGNVMRKDVNTLYTGRLASSAGWTGNVPVYFADRWKKAGDEKITNIPSYVSSYYVDFTRRSTDYYRLGDINVVSASYIKVRDVTLNYSLPYKVVQVLRIERVNLYVQTSNFMIWRANKAGIDPEYQSSGYRSVPPSKHPVSIGANVSF